MMSNQKKELFELGKYTEGSHKKVNIECEFKINENCKILYTREYRDILKNKKRNEGKYICFNCSRTLKYSGRLNPNCKYYFDDNMMNIIDTEGKAYLLGWIASDGSVKKGEIVISVHEKDLNILLNLRDIICSKLPITHMESICMVKLSICSTQISTDVCSHLNIFPGKKDSKVEFPTLTDIDLKWAFTRGFFDGDGSIRKMTETRHNPDAGITSNSIKMLTSIKDLSNISCIQYVSSLYYSGNNALDFVSKLYDNANPLFRLQRKYDIYLMWVNSEYQPCLLKDSKKLPYCSFYKTEENAVIPNKTRCSDIGYDLTIIKEVKRYGSKTIMYDTGIKVVPKYGYYTKIVPRSSIIKTGYMLSNSVGIIDPTFLGSLKVVLTKVDDSLPNIELPFTCTQLILEKAIPFEMVEVFNEDELGFTQRGDGGFGSTDKVSKSMTDKEYDEFKNYSVV